MTLAAKCGGPDFWWELDLDELLAFWADFEELFTEDE